MELCGPMRWNLVCGRRGRFWQCGVVGLPSMPYIGLPEYTLVPRAVCGALEDGGNRLGREGKDR